MRYIQLLGGSFFYPHTILNTLWLPVVVVAVVQKTQPVVTAAGVAALGVIAQRHHLH
jgi:hypothetical protein